MMYCAGRNCNRTAACKHAQPYTGTRQYRDCSTEGSGSANSTGETTTSYLCGDYSKSYSMYEECAPQLTAEEASLASSLEELGINPFKDKNKITLKSDKEIITELADIICSLKEKLYDHIFDT